MNYTNNIKRKYYTLTFKEIIMIDTIKEWVSERFEERTSWDGAMLIAIGVIVLIAGPFAKLAAYAAIAYGAWTLFKSE